MDCIAEHAARTNFGANSKTDMVVDFEVNVFLTMSFLFLSFLFLSCRASSCLTLRCFVLPCPVVSYLVVSCHAVSCLGSFAAPARHGGRAFGFAPSATFRIYTEFLEGCRHL
jgi:hypothetical protein